MSARIGIEYTGFWFPVKPELIGNGLRNGLHLYIPVRHAVIKGINPGTDRHIVGIPVGHPVKEIKKFVTGFNLCRNVY